MHSGDSGTLLLHEPPPPTSDTFREIPSANTFCEIPGGDTFRELPDPAHPSDDYGGHPALAGNFGGAGGGVGNAGAAAAAEPSDYEAALASAMREPSG